MLLKLNRTQTTKLGRLQAGVPYRFDPANPVHVKIADRLLELKFATKVTKAALDRAAQDDVELSRAIAAGEADTSKLPIAVLERARVIAQEAEEAAAKSAKAAAKKAADK